MNSKSHNPNVIILLPTTELADHVYNQAKTLFQFTQVKVTTIVKGRIENVKGNIVISTLGILKKI